MSILMLVTRMTDDLLSFVSIVLSKWTQASVSACPPVLQPL